MWGSLVYRIYLVINRTNYNLHNFLNHIIVILPFCEIYCLLTLVVKYVKKNVRTVVFDKILMKRVWPFGNYVKNKCPVLQPVMSSVGSSYYGLVDRIMEQNDKERVRYWQCWQVNWAVAMDSINAVVFFVS